MNDIESTGAAALLVGVMNMIGFALKKSPIQNWAIPWILMILGAAGYPFVSPDCHLSDVQSVVLHVIQGVFFGGAAVGLHQGVSQYRDAKSNGSSPPPASPGGRLPLFLLVLGILACCGCQTQPKDEPLMTLPTGNLIY